MIAKFELDRGVISSCKSKKDRQYNGQKETNNGPQNITLKTKETCTPLKYR
jgi:hypothetical protein